MCLGPAARIVPSFACLVVIVTAAAVEAAGVVEDVELDAPPAP